MIDHALVKQHYDFQDLPERLPRELEQAGLDLTDLNWMDLIPIDQFHSRGLVATEEIAQGLHLKPEMTVIDIGCGIGGPARYLSAVHECQVTGVDLSQSFIDVAKRLAELTRLTDRTTFVQGDALNLPFDKATFDHAVTQHVAMNISDRAGLYRNIHRVLKPGGRLAVYDLVEGNGDTLIFPVPWARGPETSFLIAPDEMRDVLFDTGFIEVYWQDKTPEGIAWFEDQMAERRANPTPNPLNISMIMGPDFARMAANVAQNLKEGRAALVLAIFEHSGGNY